jgi:hypothetical protein
MKAEEAKKLIIRANMSRSSLYLAGFLTESENSKIFSKIRKFQDKHKVEVTKEELFQIKFFEP